jgi:cytochrome P450
MASVAEFETTAGTRSATGCPHVSVRKTARDSHPGLPGLERRGDTWILRSHELVKQVLRKQGGTRQAGFNAELAARTGLRQPVLFEDGPAHHEHRTAIARFFTPATIDADYRSMMDEVADSLVTRLLADGCADVSDLSLVLAMQVAARVVGLTDSSEPGMARRLERILELERLDRLPWWRRALPMARTQGHVRHFMRSDVLPAIAARRAQPREDVISHLISKGYKDAEILIECITYGAAGMATTREFIAMAAWHLLEDDELRARYLAGDDAERAAVLHEILRLEPVVGHLYRRTDAELHLDHEGVTTTIPAGARIDLDLRSANADEGAVGCEPLRLNPARQRAPRVQPPVMSFGDGAHRCPGAFLAMAESDAFLKRFLALDLRVTGAPQIRWNDLIEGYEVRGLVVEVGHRP